MDIESTSSSHNDANQKMHTNRIEADENSKSNPIKASDQTRKAERDQRISEESDTERLRSERQSVEEKKAR